MLILKGHTAPVRSVCYSVSGKLASGGDDCKVRLWEPSSGKLIATLKADASVEAVSFQPDGKGLMVGTSDGQLSLHRGARWSRKAQVTAHAGGVRGLVHAPD